MKRQGRGKEDLRDIHIETDVSVWAEGSALISFGRTKVFCTASVSDRLPLWITKPGQGWVTAEYAMLPRAGNVRISREKSFQGGRSQEISRLIGRSLRSALNLQKLGERQIQIDCDVLQADGGTRTAAITGGFVALALACKNLKDKSLLKELPLTNYVSAVSLGLSKGEIFVDLDFKEDRDMDVDVNFVMNDRKEFIEIQGSAERLPFSQNKMEEMMKLSLKASETLMKKQAEKINSFFPLKV